MVRYFLFAALILTTTGPTVCAAEKLNVLFIVADHLRADLA